MQDMSKDEQDEVLRGARLGHLGLAAGDFCYVLPIFYGYDGETFFFHSHPGMKDDFIGQTKEACLVVSSVIGPDDWNSVQVFGPVEKCTLKEDLLNAEAAMADVPLPPEFGFMPSGKPKRSDQNTYFWKLEPKRQSGKKSAHMTRV